MQTTTTEKIRSFTDLYSWQEGHTFVLQIYKITAQFPSEEKFGLTSQLRRAAVSVTSNIAEGFRRKNAKEKCQFYTIAAASLTEIQNQLLIARDVQYIDKTTFDQLCDQSLIVCRLLKGLTRSTPSSIQNSKFKIPTP